MFNYCNSPTACVTNMARCETAGEDSIVVLSCFILCLCLDCSPMRIAEQSLFYILLHQQNIPGNCAFIFSTSCSSLKTPKNDEPLPDIDAYTAPIA